MGLNLRVSGTEILSGKATAFIEASESSTGLSGGWSLSDTSFSARALYLAGQTRSTKDDYKIIKQALSGNDTLKLSGEKDVAFGYGGKDKMFGQAGNDVLKGGNGNDRLDGGKGADKLAGGKGADKFVFKNGGGRDVVTDFQDDTDTLVLSKALWGGGLGKQQVLNRIAEVENGSVVFDFTDDTLTLKGFTDIDALRDDIALA